MTKRKASAKLLENGPREADGDPPLQWATLVDDMEEPLHQYVRSTFGYAMTPQQTTSFAQVIVNFVGPYALSERTSAVNAVRQAFDDAIAAHDAQQNAFKQALRVVLRKIVDARECRLFEGNFCVVHGYDAPCPHGQANAWLATQPND